MALYKNVMGGRRSDDWFWSAVGIFPLVETIVERGYGYYCLSVYYNRVLYNAVDTTAWLWNFQKSIFEHANAKYVLEFKLRFKILRYVVLDMYSPELKNNIISENNRYSKDLLNFAIS